MNVWTAFFGWCTVLNMGLYALTIISLALLRDMVVGVNTKLFSISEADFRQVAFQYVGAYKLAIIVLCFIPYIALKIMA